MNDTDIDELLKDIPDEFYDWVKRKQGELEVKFVDQFRKANQVFEKVKGLETRKDQAIEIMKLDKQRSGVVFSLLDGKDKRAKQLVWKELKPEYELPFKTDIDY